MVGPRGLYASVLVLLIGGAAIGSFTRDPDWTLPSDAKKAPASSGKADTAGRNPGAAPAAVADPAAKDAKAPAAPGKAEVASRGPIGTAVAGKTATDTRDRTSRVGADNVETTGSIGSGASPVRPVSTNTAGLLGGAPTERTGASRSIGDTLAAVNPAETPDRSGTDTREGSSPKKTAVHAEDEPKPRVERLRAKAKQVRPQKPTIKLAARKRSERPERTARARIRMDGGRAALMASDASVWGNPALPVSSCRLETRWAWTPAGDQPMLVRICR